MIEKQVFFANPPQFLYIMLLTIPALSILNFLCSFLFGAQIYFMAGSITMMFMYIACRENTDGNTSFWGLITLKLLYVPYLFLGLSFLLGGFSSFLEDAIGMLVGHLWYFLIKIYGPQTGTDYLKVP